MSDEDLKVDSFDVASDRGADRSERSTERAERGEAHELSGTPSAPERTPEGRFLKGTSGNPAGRPRGARGRFSEGLVTDFAQDWAQHGAEVISSGKKRRSDRVFEHRMSPCSTRVPDRNQRRRRHAHERRGATGDRRNEAAGNLNGQRRRQRPHD